MYGDSSATASVPHRRLAELKQKFDRFAVDDLLTGAEALQALTELGCTIPRRAAAAYFRERGAQGGPSRDVSFFEFLRAFAALELEDEPLSRGSRSRSSGSDSSRERLDRKVNKAARRTRDKRVEAAKETARRSRRATPSTPGPSRRQLVVAVAVAVPKDGGAASAAATPPRPVLMERATTRAPKYRKFMMTRLMI